MDAAAEGVHHGVEVGADPQAEQRDVVGGVADDGDLGRVAAVGAVRRVAGEVVPQAAQEPGSADAAREGRDPHPAILAAAAAGSAGGRRDAELEAAAAVDVVHPDLRRRAPRRCPGRWPGRARRRPRRCARRCRARPRRRPARGRPPGCRRSRR